jgi:hypothetical protein
MTVKEHLAIGNAFAEGLMKGIAERDPEASCAFREIYLRATKEAYCAGVIQMSDDEFMEFAKKLWRKRPGNEYIHKRRVSK